MISSLTPHTSTHLSLFFFSLSLSCIYSFYASFSLLHSLIFLFLLILRPPGACVSILLTLISPPAVCVTDTVLPRPPPGCSSPSLTPQLIDRRIYGCFQNKCWWESGTSRFTILKVLVWLEFFFFNCGCMHFFIVFIFPCRYRFIQTLWMHDDTWILSDNGNISLIYPYIAVIAASFLRMSR